MELHTIRYEVAEHVALVTLDRPKRLNAWTSRMEAEHRWALGEAEADPDVRVVVVTGAGRGFCAGADTEALSGSSRPGATATGTGPVRRGPHPTCGRTSTTRTPSSWASPRRSSPPSTAPPPASASSSPATPTSASPRPAPS
jgi:hypothetical protein